MNVLEFNRWAEGQRGMSAVRAFEPAETVPSEQIAERSKSRNEVEVGTEGSRSRVGRFLGTLRWGK
jgi:hypothetical protein